MSNDTQPQSNDELPDPDEEGIDETERQRRIEQRQARQSEG